jgi:hypothetical protein
MMKKRDIIFLIFVFIINIAFWSYVFAGSAERISTIITDANGTAPTVNTDGRLDTIQHAHPDHGNIHFHIESATESINFILIDISNTFDSGSSTSTYPHLSTNYIHIEWVDVQVDAGGGSAYKLSLGFLENVDASNGDRTVFQHISGAQQTGTNKELFFPFYPNGIECRAQGIASHDVSIDDTDYQTDVNLKSTLDVDNATVPAGSGDIIMEFERSAGTIDIAIDIGYHSH